MNFVLTLIADPAGRKLSDTMVEHARALLGGFGAESGDVDWLAPQLACDIPFTPRHPENAAMRAMESALRGHLRARQVDVAAQPIEGRRKKLLVSDMESTIIRNEMVDELADLLGIKEKVADITRRAMNGEISFRPALEERVALLGGLEEEALIGARERIEFNPGAKILVATMKKFGARTALVSGGFSVFTRWVAERAGFDANHSNELIIEQGIVTGKVKQPVLGKEAKLASMRAHAAEMNCTSREAIAAGDGANDLDMLLEAGTGVAYRAKPKVADAARFRIDHGDLTALLYLQGYRWVDFVNAD
ncbi:MAG: phosphoserine phosphatase SerB [Alphaproteobacteria bacterium]